MLPAFAKAFLIASFKTQSFCLPFAVICNESEELITIVDGFIDLFEPTRERAGEKSGRGLENCFIYKKASGS